MKTAQNRFLSFFPQEISVKWAFFSYSDEISPRFFSKIPAKSATFFHEFDSENPTKFDFFSVTYQRPCVMNGLHHKSS